MTGIRAWWAKRKQRKSERDVKEYDERRGLPGESATDHTHDETTVDEFRVKDSWFDSGRIR